MRLTVLLVFTISVSFGQLSLDRQVESRVQKGKWNSAEDLLRKSLRKDTLNPEARYEFSKLYLNPTNPAFQIDSSYVYILSAIRTYGLISEKEKERLLRFPLDSSILLVQRARIDSAAFVHAKTINTEAAYNEFIDRFNTSSDSVSAIELRNEVAFLDALKANTYTGYLNYLKKYPHSLRAGESRSRYERLLYEDQTRPGTLASFSTFYKNYPESPFAMEAMKNIFEIATASGTIGDFQEFLRAWPVTIYSKRAEAILYHLVKEEDTVSFRMEFSDSLKTVHQAEAGYWVPVMKNEKFGFINDHGIETVSPRFVGIKPDYLCGNIREDYLVVAEGIIGRSGAWILKSPVLEVTDVGEGFLKVNTGSCIQLIHKSGLKATDCVEDVRLIGHRFIAYRDHSKWGLSTLMGRKLEDPKYDDVQAGDQHIILVRNGKKMIVTFDELSAIADRHSLPTSRVYDDIQRLASGIYKVRNGSLEGVLNDSLQFTVPLYRQNIIKTPVGFQLQRGDRYLLTGVSSKLLGREFRTIQFYGEWVRLVSDNNLALFNYRQEEFVTAHLDSLSFENKLAFAWKRDSLLVYLKSGTELEFAASSRVTFITSADSSHYFFVEEKNKKIVFDADTGLKVFSYAFDNLDYLGRGIFLCTVGSKKGLLSDKGKVLLPVEYTAIVKAGTEMVSLLKEKKFGLYNLRTRKWLKPDYERNVLAIASRWLVAYKDGGYGFVGWDGKALGKFEFEEVRPWNDTAALVKKNFQWTVYSINHQTPLISRIKDYRPLGHREEEVMVLIHQDNQYGVMSNVRGEIIPANFSDIVNVGSEEEPLYFVEKSVEEAGIYVVIYYDGNGKFLRKEVYESEEYEKIYCAEK